MIQATQRLKCCSVVADEDRQFTPLPKQIGANSDKSSRFSRQALTFSALAEESGLHYEVLDHLISKCAVLC